jgi:hypothetical protein
MPDPQKSPISRREFATRSILVTAAATLSAVPLPAQSPAPPSNSPAPPAPANPTEADLRLQTVLGLYATRFTDDQKAGLKKICNSTQTSLDRLRAYKTENSDDPALHLKPLIEHEKKAVSPASSTQPARVATKP